MQPICSECGHEAPPASRTAMFFDRLFRTRPSCSSSDENDASGWSTECGCRHPAHAR